MSDLSQAKRALDRAKIRLMDQKDSAFFTTIAFSFKHVFTDAIPTASVSAQHLTVYYNPSFFLSLDPKVQLFVLLHEVFHVVLSHGLRLGDRDPEKWNWAGDYLINYMLKQRGYTLWEHALYDARYTDEYSTEQIYAMLPDNPPLGGGGGGMIGDILEGAGVPGEGGGDGSGDEGPGDKPLTQEQAAAIQDKIDDILIKAAIQSKMAGDQPGTIPGQLQFYIDSLLTPKLPWNRLLKAYMTKVIRRGYTWRKPNRRFFPDHYLPSRNSRGALCDIAVAVDTSASVTDGEFQQFATEVHSILKEHQPSSLKLIQFDTQIHQISDIHKPGDLLKTTFHGRGGTDMYEVMEWAIRHKPRVLLVFSDGWFPMNFRNPKLPVVWLVNNNEKFTAPFGRAIHYDI